MKEVLEQAVRAAIHALIESGERNLPPDVEIQIEHARDARHGNFSCNVAMAAAKASGRKPRELAQAIVARLVAGDLVERVEIAGPGFINFFVRRRAFLEVITAINREGERYPRLTPARPEKILVEFVSANPTGPLHVGHGRQAAFGATLGNLLEAAGFEVDREYYINDAGRQVDILAVSTWLRYLERLGETITFPSNGYRGDYVHGIAEKLQAKVGDALRRPATETFASLPEDAPKGDKEIYVDALIARARELIGADGFENVLELSLDVMLEGIREELTEFGVEFDRWYSEKSLETSGAIDRALDVLKQQARLYTQDGATWFRASEFGDEKDRVVVRENGQKTYFASDIAYHFEKRERGFERLIDVLGADHHGYVARVRAGLSAMGYPGECLEVVLIQFVNLFRGEEKIPMGKREAQFVTLRDLREEVGNDAARFFYVMRRSDQHLDFDLELAKKHSNDNPVYYIQYAHARICSVLRQMREKNLAHDPELGERSLERLEAVHETALLNALSRFPEVIANGARDRAPHVLPYYLQELSNHFHAYYNSEQFLVEDAALRNARLNLILAVRQVIRNGMKILGVSTPEVM